MPIGLGKTSQGISTALSVEKTSKRGGKIVNLAAEQGNIIVDTYMCNVHVCYYTVDLVIQWQTVQTKTMSQCSNVWGT